MRCEVGGPESWSSFSPPIPALHGNPLDGLPKDKLNICKHRGWVKERKKGKKERAQKHSW